MGGILAPGQDLKIHAWSSKRGLVRLACNTELPIGGRMKPSESLHSHREAILAIALRNGVKNVRVFGSVVHGRDRDGSDLDLLVDAPRGTTLLDMVRIQHAIEAQIGLPVDVLTAADLPTLFRDQVLLEAQPL